ncbi:hypothetical protein Tco_0776308 [Tanacetum coccineum]
MASGHSTIIQGRQGQSYSGTGYRAMLLVLGTQCKRTKKGIVNATNCQGEGIMARQCIGLSDHRNTEDLDTYDFYCDDISNAKAVLMANISNYGSDVISEVPHSETYLNDMENQSVHAM